MHWMFVFKLELAKFSFILYIFQSTEIIISVTVIIRDIPDVVRTTH